MEIYRTLEAARKHLSRSVITIGNFDGIHIGHQAIFERVKSLAARHDALSVVLTFEPHPVHYFRPDAASFRLTPLAQKAEIIARYGIDAMMVLDFNKELASKEPEQFVDEVLYKGLHGVHVIVGEGFRFGRNRAGGTDELCSIGASRGIECDICSPTNWQGEIVSSTRIRQAIVEGRVKEVTSMLGRAYALRGTVVKGEARGRTLGFPTANIATKNTVLPPYGVYITGLALADGSTRDSITNIGMRPTFDGQEVSIEAFVLDADNDESFDLYDQEVELQILESVRPEQRFEGPEALITQIGHDVKRARDYFAKGR